MKIYCKGRQCQLLQSRGNMTSVGATHCSLFFFFSTHCSLMQLLTATACSCAVQVFIFCPSCVSVDGTGKTCCNGASTGTAQLLALNLETRYLYGGTVQRDNYHRQQSCKCRHAYCMQQQECMHSHTIVTEMQHGPLAFSLL